MLGCLLPATGALAIAATNEELRGRPSGHLFMVLVAMACGLAGALGAIVGLVVLAATYVLNAYVRASHRPGMGC